MRNLLAILTLAGYTALAGCAGQQAKPQQPETKLPQQWESSTSAPGEASGAWWQNFNDTQLNTLVEHALQTNNNVAAAVIRVRRAQLQAGLVGTNRTPSVAASVNSGITRSFKQDITSRSSGISAAMGYEPDLWGKLATERDAAEWETQATEADCRAFATNLTVTTAQLYWQAAYLNQLVSISEANIDYAKKTLELVRSKHEAGAVSGLNSAQAELNLSNQEAAHTRLLQQRVETRHALALIFNQPPESTVSDRPTLPDAPLPVVTPGLPASLLANRPDLNAAELRLRESLANIDITRTSFYPTMTLTGSFGTASSALLSLLQNPVATLGAGIALPFLQWNTRKLSIRVSETQYEESVVNFRQRLYVALAEVEDALSARTQLIAEEEKLKLALSQAQRAESITKYRYQAGVTEVQRWLDAQLSLRTAERSVVSNRFSQLNNQANLYRALGLGTAWGGSELCGRKPLGQKPSIAKTNSGK